MDHTDSVIVGVTLLLVVLVVVVVEAPTGMRGRYDGAFWRKPLDDKLDHVATDLAGWRRIGLSWVPTLALTLAGVTAFSHQLAAEGSAAWAWLALGLYVLGAVAWFVGVLVQTSVVAVAAQERAATGQTPSWLAGFWSLGWWCEVTFVVLANVAAVLWGIAVLETGYPADWLGWTAIAVGAVILGGAAVTRNVFPHLGILVPVITGVALIVS